MPTYEYRCQDCNHEFDTFQSMLDDSLTVCPECKGSIKRLISKNVGIAFKGSGFYVTDSKSKSSPSTSSSTSTSTSSDTSSTPSTD